MLSGEDGYIPRTYYRELDCFLRMGESKSFLLVVKLDWVCMVLDGEGEGY